MDAVVCAFYLNDCFMMFFFYHLICMHLDMFSCPLFDESIVLISCKMNVLWVLLIHSNDVWIFYLNFIMKSFFFRALNVSWENQNSNYSIWWLRVSIGNLSDFVISIFYSRLIIFVFFQIFWIRGHPKTTKERYKPYLSASFLFQWTTYNHS